MTEKDKRSVLKNMGVLAEYIFAHSCKPIPLHKITGILFVGNVLKIILLFYRPSYFLTPDIPISVVFHVTTNACLAIENVMHT